MNTNRTRLTEADYLEKIGYFIDKHIKSGNKTTPAIADLMSYIQKRISSHKDIGMSRSKKVLQKGYDDTKLNELEMESKRKVSNKDLKQLLEFIQEAEKSDKSKSEKEPENSKQEKKSDNPKNTEKPKQEKNSEEEVISPSKSVSSLLKSSGFSNFVQDASRMSSRRDKAEAYIQMLSALPSISDAYIRKAIINKFKTRE